MTTLTPDPVTDLDTTGAGSPSEIVVTLPPEDGRRAAAGLSCRLHAAIGGASPGVPGSVTVVVVAGERAAEPDVARVLACARDSATSRGLGFEVR